MEKNNLENLEKNNLKNFNNHIENLEKRLKDNLNIYNMENNIENNIENNNLINNITMEIIQLFKKRKVQKQVNRFVKHKATIKAFDNYINKLGDDKEKLKKFNNQLSNLSKSVNTLPKLFKSFTSIKRSKKIKETITYKQALPLYEPDIIENVEHTIRKSKRAKKEQKK